MAIRDVVTGGFGNGAFSPGVNKLPTRGYSIGAVAVDLSPFCIVAFGFQIAGSVKSGFQISGSVKPNFQIAGSVVSQEGCG